MDLRLDGRGARATGAGFGAAAAIAGAQAAAPARIVPGDPVSGAAGADAGRIAR